MKISVSGYATALLKYNQILLLNVLSIAFILFID